MIIQYEQLTPELARKGCFVLNMPNDDYHAYEGISKSGLDKINISPAAYAVKEPFGTKTRQAMKIGSAVHTLFLEPNEFYERYTVLEGVDNKRGNDYKIPAKALGDDYVLTEPEHDAVKTMIDSLNNSDDPEIKAALATTGGMAEVSGFVECPDTGVLLRCRYDMLFINEQLSIDLKKVRDVTPYGFSRSLSDYRYHVQHFMYARVFKLITGNDLEFKFLCVQESAPHTCALYHLDEVALMVAEHYYNKNLSTYVECIKNNNWPHPQYSGQISITNWAITQYQEELEQEMDE